MLLYDPANKTIAGLVPEIFIGIASPFLGLQDNTYAPRFLYSTFATMFGDSGRDLFQLDDPLHPLVNRMCTEDVYLAPLRAFKRRRLYSALSGDLLVIPQTGAILDDKEVEQLRSARNWFDGQIFRAVLITKPSGDERECNVSIGGSSVVSSDSDGRENTEGNELAKMRDCLNKLGWEKVLVEFGGFWGFLPAAHIQICANERWPDWFPSFEKGQAVMDDVASCLNQSA